MLSAEEIREARLKEFGSTKSAEELAEDKYYGAFTLLMNEQRIASICDKPFVISTDYRLSQEDLVIKALDRFKAAIRPIGFDVVKYEFEMPTLMSDKVVVTIAPIGYNSSSGCVIM